MAYAKDENISLEEYVLNVVLDYLKDKRKIILDQEICCIKYTTCKVNGTRSFTEDGIHQIKYQEQYMLNIKFTHIKRIKSNNKNEILEKLLYHNLQ